VSEPLQLQQLLLGRGDPGDDRGAFGMVQGWLDWADLNPAAARAPAAAAAAAAAAPSDGPGPAGGGRGGGGGGSVATEGASAARGVLSKGGVSIGSAGVQFELSCDGCTLHIDGVAVAGTLAPTVTSACVTPAHSASGVPGALDASQQQQQQLLLHLQLLFTSRDARQTRLEVRSRPCSVAAAGGSSSSSSQGWATLAAAGGSSSSPPAFGLSASAVNRAAADNATRGSSAAYLRGMLCSVSAQLPAGVGQVASNSTGQLLQRAVLLTPEQLRASASLPAAVLAAHNSTPSAQDARQGSLAAAAPSQQPSTRRRAAPHAARSTVATPGDDVEDGSWEADSTKPDHMNVTSSAEGGANGTGGASSADQASEEDRAYAQVQRARAAKLAAAKAAALARGISVARLAPDWVAGLPGGTLYSLSCACYWNGSWPGNVTVGVTAAWRDGVEGSSSDSSDSSGGSGAASSGGAARLFLAGWPVAAHALASVLYGPSDLDVKAYSTWLQRAQLSSGSAGSDPLADGGAGALLWAGDLLGGAAAGAPSSGSSTGGLLAGLAGRPGSSGAASGSAALPAAAIRAYRALRLQQAATGRSGGAASVAGSGGSSGMASGLLPVGSADGAARREVLPQAGGWMQLLVLQAQGLAADGQVVVLAPGESDGSSGSSSSSSSNDDADSSDGRVASSWLPAPWDAWVPAA
jgi:hypothetical protein